MRDLYRYLRREGVDVWLDKEKLLPGADWDLEIRKAVRESDVVVVCLSKQFNKAGFRQKEVRIALDTAMEKPEGEIFIIPARLEECDTLESLRKWHWVDLFEKGGRQKLIYALRARAGSVGAALRRRSHRQSNTTAPEGAITFIRQFSSKIKSIIEDPAEDIRQAKTRSGFWIGKAGYVFRDGQKIGYLPNIFQHEILNYLIENKGWICSYDYLVSLVYRLGRKFNDRMYDYEVTEVAALIPDFIVQIRKVIEDDPNSPKYLIEIPGEGYRLDW